MINFLVTFAVENILECNYLLFKTYQSYLMPVFRNFQSSWHFVVVLDPKFSRLRAMFLNDMQFFSAVVILHLYVCVCVIAVPNSNLFIMINPICLSVDYLTIVWLNAFSLNLAKKAVCIILLLRIALFYPILFYSFSLRACSYRILNSAL